MKTNELVRYLHSDIVTENKKDIVYDIYRKSRPMVAIRLAKRIHRHGIAKRDIERELEKWLKEMN